MRGLVFDGPGRIRFADDLPHPVTEEPTDAIVDVTLAGLCGSDLHPYSGRERCASGVIPGHEVVGVVTEVGGAVASLRVGDRVIVPFTVSCGSCDRCTRGLSSRCRESRLFGWGDPSGTTPPLHGGQAERIRVPLADGTLVPIPERIDDATALLLTDSYPTAWHAVSRSDWTRGPLAVIGLGAVGLCAVAVALTMGIEEVVGIDPVESRRAAAIALGAHATTPDEVEGHFLSIVEAAGPPTAQRLAADLADAGATISIIAVQTDPSFAIDPVLAYDRNLTIRTGRAPVRSVLQAILPEVESLRIPTGAIVTHPDRDLRDGPDLYRLFAEREVLKATFRP
ncbi:MAG TPA: alcohol dehydrogenase catalytic domain-containing protein [Acidimicrobiia bacterium]|nr:alcohol dehydrogenase catalytic domain-containing protein [Acidimicrobiia bacterium]